MRGRQHGCTTQGLAAKFAEVARGLAGVAFIETPANGLEKGSEFVMLVNSTDGAIFSVTVEGIQAPNPWFNEHYTPKSQVIEKVKQRELKWLTSK
jgi:hypothetical protein